MWKDQRRRWKEILLTTLVREHAICQMQRACYQSIAMARDVLLRQEQWREMWEKAWARNQDSGTTHNTPGVVANISRCLQWMEAEWEDAFTICLKDNRRISLIKGDDKKFRHDLREALRDARLRMITRKDLREDAAKGIDKAAAPTSDELQTAHAVAKVTVESNTHERSMDVQGPFQGRETGV